jgi:hypothetical protein
VPILKSASRPHSSTVPLPTLASSNLEALPLVGWAPRSAANGPLRVPSSRESRRCLLAAFESVGISSSVAMCPGCARVNFSNLAFTAIPPRFHRRSADMGATLRGGMGAGRAAAVPASAGAARHDVVEDYAQVCRLRFRLVYQLAQYIAVSYNTTDLRSEGLVRVAVSVS